MWIKEKYSQWCQICLLAAMEWIWYKSSDKFQVAVSFLEMSTFKEYTERIRLMDKSNGYA